MSARQVIRARISDDEVDLVVDLIGTAIADAAAGRVSDEQIAPHAKW